MRTTKTNPPAGARRRSGPNPMPLGRIMLLADFRASLRAFLSDSERVARDWGLTPQRYLLLLLIKGAGDGSERIRFTDLADRLKLSRNTTTELVGRAEALGLVRRQADSDDKRVVYLCLTEEGERRLAGVLLETDRYRHELNDAFSALAATFEKASSD
jgi:DNA-binding MarR family transcriptional regulator